MEYSKHDRACEAALKSVRACWAKNQDNPEIGIEALARYLRAAEAAIRMEYHQDCGALAPSSSHSR